MSDERQSEGLVEARKCMCLATSVRRCDACRRDHVAEEAQDIAEKRKARKMRKQRQPVAA